MEHLIPFRPLINLLRILITYRGLHWKKLPALAPWLLKIILFEPFRLFEAFYVLLKRKKVKHTAPIFIIGFYRSGTTWLQELLSSDSQFRTPSIFQTIFPEIMLTMKPILKPVLQWVSRKLSIENDYHRLNFDWNFPGEEDVAINALSYYHDFNRIFQYPSQADIILKGHMKEPDKWLQSSWSRSHRYFTDKLSLAFPGKRLILKSPPNTGRVALLKKQYPDASFIFIERSKAECIASNKRLWNINKAFSFENYSQSQAEAVILKMHTAFHTNYHAEKQYLKQVELVEVAYDELVKSPERVLGMIYKALKLDHNESTMRQQQALITERSDYQPIKHAIHKTESTKKENHSQ